MGIHHANVDRVPAGGANINDNERKVYIGFRFVGGAVGAWTENLLSGPNIASKLFGSKMPNPNYHWCIIVGDFYHQLQATSMSIIDDGWNYYDNDKWSAWGLWEKYEIGTTRFNDVAIASAGKQAIESMPEKYHIIHNNCQTFTLRLADLICRNGRRKVYTSWDRNNLQIGFIPGQEKGNENREAEEVEVAYVEDGLAQSELLQKIDDLMLKHTPEITGEDLAKGNVGKPEKKEGEK